MSVTHLLLLIVAALAVSNVVLALKPPQVVEKEVPAKKSRNRKRPPTGPIDLDRLEMEIEMRWGVTQDTFRAAALGQVFRRDVTVWVDEDGKVYVQFKDVVERQELAQLRNDLVASAEDDNQKG
jgi:hypothetical protein